MAPYHYKMLEISAVIWKFVKINLGNLVVIQQYKSLFEQSKTVGEIHTSFGFCYFCGNNIFEVFGNSILPVWWGLFRVSVA